MKLTFDTSLASGYKSGSQIARVLTEAWFDEEMYCPACTSDGLDRLPDNTKVKEMYPRNKHVKAKIRQQMQALRDAGVVEFVDGRGTYRVR